MRTRFVFLSISVCVAMLVPGVAPGVGLPGSSGDPDVAVPDVDIQFALMQLHGDPMAFHLGVGDDPKTCKHYQGVARVNGTDGTPYMMLTRSGNSTLGCPLDPDTTGELLTVRMGSRDRDGERLRSNLLARGTGMGATAPPISDLGVSSVHFDGRVHSDGKTWPAFSHPGGVQVVGDVLVVPLEEYCSSGYDEKNECATLAKVGGLALIDVGDPENPDLLHWQFMRNMSAIGVVGVTYVGPGEHPVMSDRYLFALTWGDSTEVRFAWSNTGDLHTTTDIVLDPFVWSGDMLGADKDKWREWQTLSFVRDGDGSLYLFAAEKAAGSSGNDWVALFEVKLTINNPLEDKVIEYVQERHLRLTGPDDLDMGSLDAASGVYVSRTGQLILYTASHDNDAHGNTVGMGEFRYIDVTYPNTAARETMCPWVELYEDETGWFDTSPDRSLMLDFKDRHLEDWPNLHDENFGDATDSLRWFLEPGQKMWLFKDDTFGGEFLEVTGVGNVLSWPDLDSLGYGDEISSVWMSGVADPGGPYTGTVGVPFALDSANPCYRDGEVASFSWTVDSTSCSFSDPTARQPSLTCSEPGTFEVEVTIIEWLDVVSAGTTVTVSVNTPPLAMGFTASLVEDSAVGTTVGTVTGSDAEGDSLSYAITAGNGAGLFTIGSATGTITTAGALDYETATRHVLTVTVSDGTDSVNTTVTVNVLEVVNTFNDDDGSVFEDDIEWLAAAGITRGCNPPVNDMFCPNQSVTRGQMAAFLVRAMGYTDNGGGNLFIDDNGSVFESDIDKLGTAGITRGCNPPVNDMFCPNQSVTRGQMAAFLHRALGTA